MRFQLLNGFAEVALGIFSESAARVKLPASTTRVKALRAENRSIIRFIGYWRSLSTEGRVFFRLGHFSASPGRLQCFPYRRARSRARPVYTLTKEMHHEQKTCG